MSYSTFVRSRIGLAVIAIAAFSFTVRAQLPPEQVKMAGAIPLTTQLLDKVDKLVTAISADPAVKAEMAASEKDPGMTPESAQNLVTSKYPKLAAAFASAGLTVDEFMKVMSALPISAALAEMAGTPDDKTAVANVAFYKANKERITATLTKMEESEKSGASSP